MTSTTHTASTHSSSTHALRLTMRSVFLLGALAVSQLAPAAETVTEQLSAIDLASQQLDIQALQQFSQQAQDDYQFAYAQYRLAVTASVRADEAVLKPALIAAVDRLEQLVASEPAPTLKAEALALLAAVTGCNTVAGVGQDLRNAGSAIERAAQ